MRLKRWESPRRQGRNQKGKGGSARQRQLKKQQQMLRKKLKGEPLQNQKRTRKSQQKSNQTQKEGRDVYSLPSFSLSGFMIFNPLNLAVRAGNLTRNAEL